MGSSSYARSIHSEFEKPTGREGDPPELDAPVGAKHRCRCSRLICLSQMTACAREGQCPCTSTRAHFSLSGKAQAGRRSANLTDLFGSP